jgi:hypothetical protein
MKGKVSRGRGSWVITKIRIDGFPRELEPTLQSGVGWWRELREELRRSAPAILDRAHAAVPKCPASPKEETPPSGAVPCVDEAPAPCDEGRAPIRWMDPVFPSLVALPPPPQSVAWMRPRQPA